MLLELFDVTVQACDIGSHAVSYLEAVVKVEPCW
jgi:hypothetical protein